MVLQHKKTYIRLNNWISMMVGVHSNCWVAYIPDLLELAYFEAPFAAIS